MPIKDRDGNVYKIQGPNPVMKEQEFWDKSKLKFINFNIDDEIVKDDGKRTVIKDVINKDRPRKKEDIENLLVFSPEPKIEPKTIIKEISKPGPVVEIPEPVVEIPEPVVEIPEPVVEIKQPEKILPPKPKSEMSRTSGEQPNFYDDDQKEKIRQKKIQVYCLPVFDRNLKDDIYGDTYTVKAYGDKFTFEAVMVEEEDLFCRFWTNTKIPSSSVVYPKNHSRRWWQVQELESLDGGYMIYAAPTHANPDFTD